METDVAIIGVSFKMPQEAEDERRFWSMLEKRRNVMTEWADSRVNLDVFYDADAASFNKVLVVIQDV
jgi:acyl transferase domain-containing protein